MSVLSLRLRESVNDSLSEVAGHSPGLDVQSIARIRVEDLAHDQVVGGVPRRLEVVPVPEMTVKTHPEEPDFSTVLQLSRCAM